MGKEGLSQREKGEVNWLKRDQPKRYSHGSPGERKSKKGSARTDRGRKGGVKEKGTCALPSKKKVSGEKKKRKGQSSDNEDRKRGGLKKKGKGRGEASHTT